MQYPQRHLNALFFTLEDYESAFECHIIYYFNSPIWNLNAISYWNYSQLLAEKVKNPLCVIFSYFDTRVPTPNEQPFLHFIIFFTKKCHIHHCFHFLMYYSYLDVASLFQQYATARWHSKTHATKTFSKYCLATRIN